MSTPVGRQLQDGFSTRIEFSLNTGLALWELEIQPMGIDGGEGIPQSNMRNTAWETTIGRALKTLTAADLDCHFDEKVYGDLVGMVNKNQQLIVTFPTSGRTITFWGRIRSFQPQKMRMHNKPVAKVVVDPSNLDNSGAEVAPVVGTTSTTATTTTTTQV